jgi:hypothetical protein
MTHRAIEIEKKREPRTQKMNPNGSGRATFFFLEASEMNKPEAPVPKLKR